MYWLRVIVILLVAALLQATVIPALAVRGVRPDLVLLAAACIAVREHTQRGWRWRAFWVGWVAGLLVDVYGAGAGAPFGVTALVFGLLAMVVSKMGEELFIDSCIAQVLILAPLCVAGHGVLAVVRAVWTGYPWAGALTGAFWTGLYSALVAPLVFAALRPFVRRFGVPSRRSFRRA